MHGVGRMSYCIKGDTWKGSLTHPVSKWKTSPVVPFANALGNINRKSARFGIQPPELLVPVGALDIQKETAHWEVLTILLQMEKQKTKTHSDRHVNLEPGSSPSPKEPVLKTVPWDGALGRRPLDKVDEGQSYCSTHTTNTRKILHL